MGCTASKEITLPPELPVEKQNNGVQSKSQSSPKSPSTPSAQATSKTNTNSHSSTNSNSKTVPKLLTPQSQKKELEFDERNSKFEEVKMSYEDEEIKHRMRKVNEQSPHINLDTFQNTNTVKVNGNRLTYKLDYCYVSQKGFYPTDTSKANQDSYLVCENILGNTSCHLFGVFDGHGEFGDLCSHFSANEFDGILEKQIKNHGGLVSFNNDDKLESFYTKAFVETNNMLHKSKIDDSLSGTTAITVVVHEDHLYVANVGDSRAIIASQADDGKLKYSPLSHDQTPFRRDERERVKKLGAIVASLDQIEGYEPMHENWGTDSGDEINESSDPPRLWDQSQEKPGCAFTRSIGDAVAEEIGVYAEPELLVWPITERDKFAIIASDGVFEFLTSQAVVDLVTKFESPLDAAKHVVAEAYRLWLTYDERTDDITIIIITFDDIKLKPIITQMSMNNDVLSLSIQNNSSSVDYINPRSSPRVTLSSRKDSMLYKDNRPVRRVLAERTKRRVISGDQQFNNSDAFRLTPRTVPKSAEEVARITALVQDNFLFAKLSDSKRQLIIRAMRSREVEENEIVITEGEKGDDMYIIDSGEFTVLKKNMDGDVEIVFEYTNAGGTFGELSLMYSQPRAATVQARTAGRLWSIDRQTFRAILLRNVKGGAGLLEIFKAIPLFEITPFPQVQRLCQLLYERIFEKGDILVSPENPPDWVLCLVVSGTLVIKSKYSKDLVRESNTYILGDEVKLLKGKVEATCSGRIVCLSRTVFEEVMGTAGKKALQTQLRAKSTVRGKSLERRLSFVNDPERFNISKGTLDRNIMILENHVAVCGNFGYLGTFQNKITRQVVSLKVVAKARAAEANVDVRFLTERQILTALNGMNSCLPRVVSVFQDARVVILEYADAFRCDLSLAIQNVQISIEAKVYFIACIYSAIATLHENAVMHRFINSSSIYLTELGVPKLLDMQYAKRMDGSKSYTICGDPYFFAPEIVSNQGYDYAADLWAYGMLVFELFEGVPIFGWISEETKLFEKISSFSGDIKFSTITPPPVRELISNLLRVRPESRLGYLDMKQVRECKVFKDIQWSSLGEGVGHMIDLTSSVEPGTIFDESKLEPYSSDIFNQF